jgi:carbon storage regulator
LPLRDAGTAGVDGKRQRDGATAVDGRSAFIQGGSRMLVLSRKVGESLVIDGGIVVRLVAVNGQRVRLGIEAPADVGIWRAEVSEKRELVADLCDIVRKPR